MAPSGPYEDEETTFYDWKAEYAESGRAFENWGQISECWNCNRVPGSEVCSGCNQMPKPVYYARGLRSWRIEPGRAVKRTKPLERLSPYPAKGEKEPSHWREVYESVITQHLRLQREQELVLQAEYIETYGTIQSCPWEAAKPKDDYKFKIIPHSSGQYSLAFTMRKDLLEWLIINQIDFRRAKKSHH